jgi:hypothetical protein
MGSNFIGAYEFVEKDTMFTTDLQTTSNTYSLVWTLKSGFNPRSEQIKTDQKILAAFGIVVDYYNPNRLGTAFRVSQLSSFLNTSKK